MKRHAAGFSLIELLVGLLVSMFLMLGVSSYFQQSKSTFDYQRAQSGQLQSERFVSFIISNMVRHAGYSPLNEDRLQGLASQFPAAPGFALAQYVSGTDGTHNVAVNGESALQTYPNDTLSVRYIGAPGMSRCSGEAAAADALLVDTLSVNGIQLLCDTGAEAARLLGADDLRESLQTRVLGMNVTFGEDLDNNGSADLFSNAAGVSNWNDVITAQLELHIQSGNQSPKSLQLNLVFENVFGADQL